MSYTGIKNLTGENSALIRQRSLPYLRKLAVNPGSSKVTNRSSKRRSKKEIR